MTNPWNLVVAGRLEKAVAAYTAAIQQEDGSISRHNRATALLLLGRLQEAFRDVEQAEALGPSPKGPGYFHGDGDQLRLGAIEWLSGKHEPAGDRWLRVVEALIRGRVAYSDVSGGVGAASLLRFAAARLHRADLRLVADKLMSKLQKRPGYRFWPGPLGALYLGACSAEHVASSVSVVPILRERQLCQAYFAIGVMELERGNLDAYRLRMSAAASLPHGFHHEEFFLARYESATSAHA